MENDIRKQIIDLEQYMGGPEYDRKLADILYRLANSIQGELLDGAYAVSIFKVALEVSQEPILERNNKLIIEFDQGTYNKDTGNITLNFDKDK